jgi:hypothetical protein
MDGLTMDNEEPGRTGNVISILPYLEREHGRMFKIEEVAPRDEKKTKAFSVLGQSVEVTYFRNRLTLENDLSAQARAKAEAYLKKTSGEDSDDDVEVDESDLTSWEIAMRLEMVVFDWDLYGPLRHPNTGDVVIEDGVKIPIDAHVIKLIPLRIVRKINQDIIDEELGGNANSKQKR